MQYSKSKVKNFLVAKARMSSDILCKECLLFKPTSPKKSSILWHQVPVNRGAPLQYSELLNFYVNEENIVNNDSPVDTSGRTQILFGIDANKIVKQRERLLFSVESGFGLILQNNTDMLQICFRIIQICRY